MKFSELLKEWERHSAGPLTADEYLVRLPLRDAARIRALAELFPLRTESQIITDLLRAALDEVQAAFPYVEGADVIEEDEFGDPVYEDAGAMPRFLHLTREHLRRLEQEARAASPRGVGEPESTGE